VTRSSLLVEEVVSIMITGQDTETLRALRGLADRDASVRLRAAMAVGSAPDPGFVGTLVERCAVEPEFYVRDMLTWALTRHPAALTLPALLREVRSGPAQARSQALHTLSKIGDRSAWPVITRELLTDADDEVARSAWRAAVALVPEDGRPELARVLATQLGRGGRETRLRLSRALVALGEVVEREGVTILGLTNLPSTMPYHASQLYARNVAALLQHLAPQGKLELDWTDEITAGACVTRKREAAA